MINYFCLFLALSFWFFSGEPFTTAMRHADFIKLHYFLNTSYNVRLRSSRPEVLLRKGVLKICSKFTGEHPCRGVISIKLLCSEHLFLKTALDGCFCRFATQQNSTLLQHLCIHLQVKIIIAIFFLSYPVLPKPKSNLSISFDLWNLVHVTNK